MGELRSDQVEALVKHADKQATELTSFRAENERLRAVVLESLEVVRYPDNGALICRWCGADSSCREPHDPACWYARHSKHVCDYMKAARAALTPDGDE